MKKDETSLEKGNRHENEATDILQRVYGAGVEKVDAWGNHDPFGFVDIIAINEDERVKFIQVKTNQFTTKHKEKYKKRIRHLPHQHAVFEVWVRYDREGWEIFKYTNDQGFDLIHEIPICDSSKAGDKYRSLHPRITE